MDPTCHLRVRVEKPLYICRRMWLVGLLCLMPLSTIFQLYRGEQLYVKAISIQTKLSNTFLQVNRQIPGDRVMKTNVSPW